jgi:hypothetical protein
VNKITSIIEAVFSIWPALAAAFVVMLLSEKHSFKLAAARVASALLLALTATDPIIELLGRSADTWRDVVLVLLGVMGFQIMKFLASFNKTTALEFLRAWRGK